MFRPEISQYYFSDMIWILYCGISGRNYLVKSLCDISYNIDTLKLYEEDNLITSN